MHVADYGPVIEAYDQMPTRRSARRLAVATRAERHCDWRGWRVESGDGQAVKQCTSKSEARRWVELFADRTLAEQGPEFYAAQLDAIAAAVRDRDGVRILAGLQYLAAEGDARVAAELAAHMRASGLIEDGAR
jgi:hypothetical protein